MSRLAFGFTLFGLLGLSTSAAQAQTSVYANLGVSNYGFSNIVSGEDTSFKGDAVGFGGGAFYDFPIQSRVTIGVDGRFEYSPGYDGGLFGGGAIRIGFVPHRNPLRPYFQVGGGAVHSSYNETIVAPVPSGGPGLLTTTTITRTSGAGQFIVGLDIRLNDHWDVRAPELGSEASAGNGVHVSTAFLNVGLVYHLKPRKH